MDKKCTRCKETKALDQFYKREASRDGLSSQCKSCQKIGNLKYRAAHLEKASAYQAEYRAGRLEKTSDYNRKYRAKNSRKASVYQRRYRAMHAEKISAYKSEWKRVNPEAVQLQGHRRQARKLGNEVFAVTVKELMRLKAHPCYLCNSAKSTTIEHIIPVTKGGRWAIGNLLGACGPCNSSKFNKYLVEYRMYLRQTAPEQASR